MASKEEAWDAFTTAQADAQKAYDKALKASYHATDTHCIAWGQGKSAKTSHFSEATTMGSFTSHAWADYSNLIDQARVLYSRYLAL